MGFNLECDRSRAVSQCDRAVSLGREGRGLSCCLMSTLYFESITFEPCLERYFVSPVMG